MARAGIFDAEGNLVNVIELERGTRYDPPEDHTIRFLRDDEIANPDPPPIPVDPETEELQNIEEQVKDLIDVLESGAKTPGEDNKLTPVERANQNRLARLAVAKMARHMFRQLPESEE